MSKATRAQVIQFPGPARRQRQEMLRQEAVDTALVVLGMAQRLAASGNVYTQELGEAVGRVCITTLSALAQEGEE